MGEGGIWENKTPVDRDWLYDRKCYFADIIFLDEQLGKIRHALEENGILENTYIILLSDHGDLLSNHGFYLKEEKHYDACIRIPLIIAGKGLQADVVCDKMVQVEDICPTVYEMASILPLPAKMTGSYLPQSPYEITPFYGESLLPLCSGEDVAWREAVYVESYNSLWSVEWGDWARTIRINRYRYTYYPNHFGDQLFDLQTDLDE